MSDRLSEIKERHSKATDGPWGWYSYGEKCYGFGVGQFMDDKKQLVSGEVTEGDPSRGEPIQVEHVCEMENQAGGSNAPFIAHSWEDIRWLVAEVERQHATIGEALERLREPCTPSDRMEARKLLLQLWRADSRLPEKEATQ